MTTQEDKKEKPEEQRNIIYMKNYLIHLDFVP